MKTNLDGKTFDLAGMKLPYFVHPYNTTWDNERAVEVPVALAFYKGKVLEVGRVLPHYIPHSTHHVVDKHEPGAINVDIFDYKPVEKYDTILSISTFEHVGFDDPSPKPGSTPLKAIEHAKQWLKPNGKMLVTLPLGFNPAMDADLATNLGSVFDKAYCMVRGEDGYWGQTEGLKIIKYAAKWPAANSLLIGLIGVPK
jgi:SAM-dependent methyltransferase